MKTNRIALKAVAAALLALSGGYAAATGSQDLTVTATVTTVCKFTTGSAIVIPFGSIDPSLAAGAKTASISVPYKCTKGTTAPAVTITGGGSTLTATAGTMVYSIAPFSTATGAGFASAATNATSTATIAQAVYQDAFAGSYTDTVTLEIAN